MKAFHCNRAGARHSLYIGQKEMSMEDIQAKAFQVGSVQRRTILQLLLSYGLILFTIMFAVALRVFLISQGWPVSNSDEGTMGIMALHIAYRGELPIFFYGQSYMGTLEAYIGAVLFHLFGPSPFALRLGLVFMFSLFLLIMYLLTRLLYTEKLALISIILLCFGSNDMLTRQLKAIGGPPETMLFGSLILLLAFWLALSFDQDSMTTCRRRRSILYGCLGCTIGLGLWSQMLVIPFILVALLPLILFCRSELRTKLALFSFLIGLCIGSFPMLLFNIQYPLQNSLVTLWQLHSTGGTSQSTFSPWQSLLGTVLVSVPLATGANLICPLPGQHLLLTSCILPQGIWGIGYVLLLAIAVFLTLKELRTYRHALKSVGGQFIAPLTEEKRSLILYTARLMLLGSAGLTLLSYALSPAPALVAVTSSRYLVGLLVATPAIISPLLQRIARVSQPGRGPASQGGGQPRPYISFSLAIITTLLRYGVLCFIGATLLMGTFSTFQAVPDVQQFNRQQDQLIGDLLRIHAAHIYSDYWTCDRLIFQSNERIICGVLADNLQPGMNRYLPYYMIVQNDPNAAYVLPLGSLQDTAFTYKMLSAAKRYQHFVFEGFDVYQPEKGTRAMNCPPAI